jgi:hypothetical protein
MENGRLGGKQERPRPATHAEGAQPRQAELPERAGQLAEFPPGLAPGLTRTRHGQHYPSIE